MPALEPLAGCGSWPTPAALDAARWHSASVDASCRFAPDEALGSARPASSTRRPGRDRRAGGGLRRAPVDARGPRRVVGTSTGRCRRRRRPRPGQGRRRAGEGRLAAATAAHRSSSRPRTRTSSSSGSDGAEPRSVAVAPADHAGTSRATAYDVVIVGGGGHGLATAYYLATRHGITNVAVLEADYIASGNTGRNTTIIRSNYAVPEAIRFYDHSLQLYAGLEAETGRGDLPPDEGPRLARPHRDGDADRAGAVPHEPGDGRPHRMLLARRDQGAHPPDRPDRRRPLPDPRRVAPRRRRRPPATIGSRGRSRPGRPRGRPRRSSTRR